MEASQITHKNPFHLFQRPFCVLSRGRKGESWPFQAARLDCWLSDSLLWGSQGGDLGWIGPNPVPRGVILQKIEELGGVVFVSESGVFGRDSQD